MSGIHRFRVQKIMLNQCFTNINFILAQKYWSISFPTVGKDRQYRLVNENWCHPVIPTPVPSMHTSIPLILLFEYSHPFPNPLFCSYPRHIVSLLFECGRGSLDFFLILHWHKLTLNTIIVAHSDRLGYTGCVSFFTFEPKTVVHVIWFLITKMLNIT